MTEEIHELFTSEVREKRLAANGIHHKKGRRGLVGTMITPADLAGEEYRSAGNIEEFHLDDLIARIESSPTLKDLITHRMDDQYRQYRQATEDTLNLVTSIVSEALHRFESETLHLKQRLQFLEGRLADLPPAVDGNPFTYPLNWSPSKRIRWGSSQEEIKATIFQHLQRLQASGKPICVETIKLEVPGMLRWLYGEKAVFKGLKGLHQEYRKQFQETSNMFYCTSESSGLMDS